MRYLIGIGTYTGFDDAIGLRVAEAVSARGLDRGFRSIELAGNLVDLVHYLDGDVDRVLLVDAARMGLAPGEHAFFAPGEVETRKQRAGLSTHEADLMKVLDLAALHGGPLPRITILGIEPADVGSGVGLSAVLEGRLEEYVEQAVRFFGSPD